MISSLRVEHFDASDRGAVYGIPCILQRLDQSWIGARTPIKNLYLTGADDGWSENSRYFKWRVWLLWQRLWESQLYQDALKQQQIFCLIKH
ncbi:hypothetical protein IQ247_13250 [Plectonema cf. radiosum LEGE 06105]|uniref:Uncharacterized protein n=1 Tax=Plectonema cf. radiosum LEGE 06105 TaxID=945769 RepID=A0A8J7F0D9_9CYAN|nr:hypothetical protein [Plectonema radiosum]MBE9213621.1 hypothetical protein [Plectonema cf. radiosum LEGE 06105]